MRWALACVLSLGVASAVSAQSIVDAAFGDPTTRYSHGVLGDAVEYGSLTITSKTEMGAVVTQRIELPQDHVFEDIAPRLWDVTGDGAPEVVVIETDVALGAALAIYGPRGKLAETPHIGRTNRWLAPIGAADLDGDGRIEIAYIDRPHLAKVLRVWALEGGEMVQIATADGLTTHKIGHDFLQGSIISCGGRPTIVTANANWTRKMGTTLSTGTLSSRDIGRYRKPESLTSC